MDDELGVRPMRLFRSRLVGCQHPIDRPRVRPFHQIQQIHELSIKLKKSSIKTKKEDEANK